MSRFFFDVCENAHVMYDYSGKLFPGLDAARQYAELLALDLGLNEEVKAPMIQVRDVSGQLLLALSSQ